MNRLLPGLFDRLALNWRVFTMKVLVEELTRSFRNLVRTGVSVAAGCKKSAAVEPTESRCRQLP